MTRSIWKGPFVDGYLLKKADKVRESGRKTVCSNNVRQLALGLMNFESSHGQLPMGLKSFEGLGGSGADSTLASAEVWSPCAVAEPPPTTSTSSLPRP